MRLVVRRAHGGPERRRGALPGVSKPSPFTDRTAASRPRLGEDTQRVLGLLRGHRGQREPHVHEYPVAGRDRLVEQPDVDGPRNAG